MSVCLLLLLFRLQFFTYKFSTSCPARRGENALNILEVCVLQTDMYKYIFPLEHTHTHAHYAFRLQKFSAQPSPVEPECLAGYDLETCKCNISIYLCMYMYVYAECSYVCICVWQPCTCSTVHGTNLYTNILQKLPLKICSNIDKSLRNCTFNHFACLWGERRKSMSVCAGVRVFKLLVLICKYFVVCSRQQKFKHLTL